MDKDNSLAITRQQMSTAAAAGLPFDEQFENKLQVSTFPLADPISTVEADKTSSGNCIIPKYQHKKQWEVGGPPISTHFSIAEIWKGRTQQTGCFESPKVSLAADSTLDQEQHCSKKKISEEKNREPGQREEYKDQETWRSLSRLSVHEGSASIPLEVGSPTKLEGYYCGLASVLSNDQNTDCMDPEKTALSAPCSSADEYHARGYALRKQGNFTGAIQAYTQALEQEPSHFKAVFNRAFSYDKVRIKVSGNQNACVSRYASYF